MCESVETEDSEIETQSFECTSSFSYSADYSQAAELSRRLSKRFEILDELPLLLIIELGTVGVAEVAVSAEACIEVE